MDLYLYPLSLYPVNPLYSRRTVPPQKFRKADLTLPDGPTPRPLPRGRPSAAAAAEEETRSSALKPPVASTP